MIKMSLLFLMIALVVSGATYNTEAGQGKKHQGFSISTGPGKSISDCSQVRLTVRDGDVAQSEQTKTIPKNSISSLQVQAPRNGGIHIEGWDGNEYSIRACLSAVGDTTAEAKALLDQLSLSVRDGRVTVEGPSEGTWVGYLLVQAPNGASIDLESTNGPISLNAISASVEARTLNGPISFSDVVGQVRAHAQNGPINVSGNKGDFRLEAQNGPIGVELEGSRWESGELEATTQNGPLSLTLPASYQSAVRVEASRHSPVECRAIQCKQAARTWDKPNIIEFGDSAPVIRMSTVNGPVTIDSTGDKHR
jgi:putative adhesin